MPFLTNSNGTETKSNEMETKSSKRDIDMWQNKQKVMKRNKK